MGKEYPALSLRFQAKCSVKYKKRWMNWSGDAFYDWQERKIAIPKGGRLVGSAFPPDLSSWDDHDGVIPEDDPRYKPNLLQGTIYNIQQWDDAEPVPDLQSL
jgi:hypothetical protein